MIIKTFTSFQIFIVLLAPILVSSCDIKKETNPHSHTTKSTADINANSKQEKYIKLLEACSHYMNNPSVNFRTHLPKGIMTGFTCDDIREIFTYAEPTKFNKAIPCLELICKRDCLEEYKKFLKAEAEEPEIYPIAIVHQPITINP